MASSELHKLVINHLLGGERGQQKALEIFLQASTSVEKALKILFSFEHTQRRVSQDAILHFVESLPQVEWVIFACDQMLEVSGCWDKWAVARVLRKAMARTTGKTLMQAEICWIQCLGFSDRAVASSASVTIKSAIGDNDLYVAGGGFDYDKNNQSPFCWKGEWTPDEMKELWRLIPTSVGSSDFFLANVFAEGYLYASSIPVSTDRDGYALKRVLVQRGNDLPGATGVWRLLKLEGNTFTFYNASQDAFLSCLEEAADGSRRAAVMSSFHPLDEKRSKCRGWTINTTTVSLLEKGMHEFFARGYGNAVQTFSKTLALMDEISAADRTKVLSYRMVAHLLLKNESYFKQDLAVLFDTGGYPSYFIKTLSKNLNGEDREILELHPELYSSWISASIARVFH